jgi:F1F0 ATPase subunit 2
MNSGWLAISLVVVAGFAAGAALGWIFYTGLYRTVRALGHARRPALLLGGSLLLRMLVLLTGFWLLLLAGERWAGDGWVALVPGLLGVIVVRILLLRRYGRPGADRPPPGEPARDNRGRLR